MSIKSDDVNAKRFWDKVKVGPGCWEWQATKRFGGYGNFSVKGRMAGAHRVSYALAHGECPGDVVVMHACDNPACVRPDHLQPGTQAENLADMRRKGRGSKPPTKQGEGHHLAKANDETVRLVREARAAGATLPDLSRRFGVPVPTVWTWVRGKVRAA